MDAFLKPLDSLAAFDGLASALTRETGLFSASGCTDAQKPHLIYALGRTFGGARLIVTFSEQRARQIQEDCRFFEPSVRYFPAKDILFYQADIRGNAITRERMAVYKAMLEEECPVIVTTFDALMDRMVPPETTAGFRMTLACGDTVSLESVRSRLVGMGYSFADRTEEPGEYSVRGGILDIFPLTEEFPYRIEFWGDEIDSVRSFSVESQRSLEYIRSLTI